MQGKPLVGLICDHHSAVLEGLINRAGYRAVRVQPDRLDPSALPSVIAWVIDCADTDPVADKTALLEPRVVALSNRPSPRDHAAYRSWCERIILTLDRWTGVRHQEDGEGSPSHSVDYGKVQGVWILAGSTGAFTAVRRFLAALTRTPPVAFIYAQHIHHRQQSTLAAIGLANRELCCYLALGRHWLNCGHVLIVPASAQLRFARYGEVFSTRDPWPTPETPNIDQLMLAACGIQPAPAGAIVFSGAGTDGCQGLGALYQLGTRVWAQDPSTCEASSMPEAAIQAELTSLVAEPETLAGQLLSLYPRSAE